MINKIVAERLRKVFALDVEHYMAFCNSFPERLRHVSFGNNAIGGERHGRESTIEWYARVARLMPGLTFSVDDVRVTGWPWDMQAVVIWRNSFDCGGVTFPNCGAHIFKLKWGKVQELLIYSDTSATDIAMDAIAASGNDEANAPPIQNAAST